MPKTVMLQASAAALLLLLALASTHHPVQAEQQGEQQDVSFDPTDILAGELPGAPSACMTPAPAPLPFIQQHSNTASHTVDMDVSRVAGSRASYIHMTAL